MSFLLRLSHAEIPSGSMEWTPDWEWNSSSRCYQPLGARRTKHSQSNPFTSTDPSNDKMDFSPWYCKAFIPFSQCGKLWKGVSLSCGQNISLKSLPYFWECFFVLLSNIGFWSSCLLHFWLANLFLSVGQSMKEKRSNLVIFTLTRFDFYNFLFFPQ